MIFNFNLKDDHGTKKKAPGASLDGLSVFDR
jgi:hypothetical protein